MATQTPAVNNPPQHKEVEHFSDAERTEWLKTGKMPALEAPADDKKVSPSDDKSKDASAASTPASEDGGEKSGSGPGKKARTQDENWRTLEAERNTAREKLEAAEKELEEFRTGKKKPEEKKVEADAGPKLLELPKRPSMAQFRDAAGALDYEKYEAALDKYETDKEAYTNQQVQIRTAAQQQEQSIKTWQAELKTKYGEKADGIDVKKTVDALAGTLQAAPAFFMFLNDSEVFTDLVYVLGTDPKLDELLAEAKDPKTVTRAIRKLVALEAGVKAELSKQVKKEEPVKKENLTKAGKPPVEAGGGSSSPEDDGSADAAWRRKDLSPSERGELYRERKNKEDREKRKKKVN
jgi:hypothetical protein